MTNWKKIGPAIKRMIGPPPTLEQLIEAKKWANRTKNIDPFSTPTLLMWKIWAAHQLIHNPDKPFQQEEETLHQFRAKTFANAMEKPIGHLLAPLPKDSPSRKKPPSHAYIWGAVIPLRPGGYAQSLLQKTHAAKQRWVVAKDAPHDTLPVYTTSYPLPAKQQPKTTAKTGI
jgi:hypothetical protein